MTVLPWTSRQSYAPSDKPPKLKNISNNVSAAWPSCVSDCDWHSSTIGSGGEMRRTIWCWNFRGASAGGGVAGRVEVAWVNCPVGFRKDLLESILLVLELKCIWRRSEGASSVAATATIICPPCPLRAGLSAYKLFEQSGDSSGW